jgi:hypothetical protein
MDDAPARALSTPKEAIRHWPSAYAGRKEMISHLACFTSMPNEAGLLLNNIVV